MKWNPGRAQRCRHRAISTTSRMPRPLNIWCWLWVNFMANSTQGRNSVLLATTWRPCACFMAAANKQRVSPPPLRGVRCCRCHWTRCAPDFFLHSNHLVAAALCQPGAVGRQLEQRYERQLAHPPAYFEREWTAAGGGCCCWDWFLWWGKSKWDKWRDHKWRGGVQWLWGDGQHHRRGGGVKQCNRAESSWVGHILDGLSWLHLHIREAWQGGGAGEPANGLPVSSVFRL